MRRRLLLGVLANTFKWLKDKFIYIYNSIIPSKLPTTNIWDEEWELGLYSSSDGSTFASDSYIRSKSTNYIPVIGGATYYYKSPKALRIIFYDINKNFISYADRKDNTYQTPANASYIRFSVYDNTYGTTYNHDICINVSNPQINGIYFPYKPKKVQDKARLTMVEGNSEVGNQLLKPLTSNDWLIINATGSFENNVCTFTATAQYGRIQSETFPVVKGHKYLALCWLKLSSALNTNIYVLFSRATNVTLGYAKATTDWQLFSAILDNQQDGSAGSVQVGDNRTSGWDAVKVKEYQFIDLTQRFPFDTPTSINDPRVQNIIRQGYKDFNAGKIEDSVVSEIEHRRVPKGYKELTYIESSGTQYIDTGVTGDNDIGFNIDVIAKNQADQVWFGIQTFFQIGSNSQSQDPNNYTRTYFGWNGVNTAQSDRPSYQLGSKNNFKLNFFNSREALFNNAGDPNYVLNFATILPTTKTITLFCRKDYDNSLDWFSSIKVCSFQISKGKELIRDFIPCYRESDNVIGLYDAVNGVFYTNAGTGTFIKGEEVEYTNNKILLPQPLKLAGVGTAHNTFEITKENYVFTRKVFDALLDNLTWELQGGGGYAYWWASSSISNIKYVQSNTQLGNFLAQKYMPRVASGMSVSTTGEMSVDVNNIKVNTGSDIIQPTGKLTYELATPQVITIPKKHFGCVRIADIQDIGTAVYGFIFQVSNAKKSTNNASVNVGIYCSKLITTTFNSVYSQTENMVICARDKDSSYNGFVIRDTSCSTTAELRSKYNDVVIYYETENEVADFIDELECRPNGVLNANQSRVPHEYQEVEYINISGYDFVNTGVIGNLNTKIVVDFYAVAMSTNKTWANVGIGGNYIQPNLSMDGTYRTSRFSDKTITTVNVLSVGNRYKLEIDKTSLRLNGNVLDYFNATASFETPYYLRIGAITNIAGDYVDGSNNFYSCQIYDNDVLVRNFIPCFRKSDGVIGLYDVVEGKFYTNQGTGTFLKGGNIESPICEVLPNVEVELKCK